MISPASALPVLYLPGGGGSSATLRRVAERLALRRAPILTEYPGLGSLPPEPTLGSAAELLDHVVRTLPARVDVVARSMGCLLALDLCLRYPERVRRLVLLVPAGGVDAVALGGVDWRPAFRALRPAAPTWLVDDRRDFTSRLREVHAPTLLVLGDQDLVSPVAVGRHLAAHLPRARLEVLTGGTHDLDVEQPDVVASLIEAHFRGCD